MFWTALPRNRPSSETSSTSSSLKASGSTRTSESIPTVRAPTTSGAARRQRSPSSLNSSSSAYLRSAMSRRYTVWPVLRTSSSSEPATGRREPGGKTVSAPGAGSRDHPGGSLVREHDCRAVERDEAAQLPDEGREGLLDLEGRAERAGAAIRSVEQVDPAAELVTEALGFRGAPLRDDHLPTEPVHEPADDRAHRELEPERERDVVEREAPAARNGRYATTRLRRGSGSARAASQGRRRGRSGAPPPRPGRRGAGGSASRARTR